MLGGYNNFGKGAVAERTFTNLPAHSIARIYLNFWKIDSWDGEYVRIYVDN